MLHFSTSVLKLGNSLWLELAQRLKVYPGTNLGLPPQVWWFCSINSSFSRDWSELLVLKSSSHENVKLHTVSYFKCISNVYLVKGGVTGCAQVLVWDLGTCCHSLFLCDQSVFYLSSNGYCEKSQRKQFSIKVIVNPRSSSTLLLPWCKYLWSLSACTWVGVRITKYLKGGLVDEPIQEVCFSHLALGQVIHFFWCN